MIRVKRFQKNLLLWICTLLLLTGLVWPPFIPAEETEIPQHQNNSALPQEIETGLTYLLELVHKKETAFQPARIAPLLDFITKGGYDLAKLKPAERESGHGISLQGEVNAPLERILRYVYNPRIPNYVFSPNAVRLSGWYPESDIVRGKVELWNELSTLSEPLVLRGKEYEVNTPDQFSGSYYRYDLTRLYILLKHNNKKILITVSKMPKPSDAGKKAVIIDEKNWDYFYSGIKGLNLRLIGFLDTYIYDSASVQILYETDAATPRTRLTLFKWLKAGWRDMNMVTSNHIYDGSLRYIEGLKEVMESESLPAADIFAQQINYINTLSKADIDTKIREYSNKFEHMAKGHKHMSKKEFAGIISKGGYARVLNREERLGVLVLECLKNNLGKPALVEFDFPALPKKKLAKTGSNMPIY